MRLILAFVFVNNSFLLLKSAYILNCSYFLYVTVTVENLCAGEEPVCLNGGYCVPTIGSYDCRCASGWTGVNCESGEYKKRHYTHIQSFHIVTGKQYKSTNNKPHFILKIFKFKY